MPDPVIDPRLPPGFALVSKAHDVLGFEYSVLLNGVAITQNRSTVYFTSEPFAIAEAWRRYAVGSARDVSSASHAKPSVAFDAASPR